MTHFLVFTVVALLMTLLFVYGALDDKKRELNNIYRALAWGESKRPFLEKLKPKNYTPITAPNHSTVDDKNFNHLLDAVRHGSSPYFKRKDTKG